MPSPNEMQVLRITGDAEKVNPVRNKTPETSTLPLVRISNGVNKSTISRRMEITTIYADYLLATLAMKGYLQKARQGKFGVYRLRPKGREALAKIRLIKWVGAREREVLKLVSELRRASTNVISRKLEISNDYALLMCKSLAGLDLRAAYLEEIKPSVYELTPLGEEWVAKKK